MLFAYLPACNISFAMQTAPPTCCKQSTTPTTTKCRWSDNRDACCATTTTMKEIHFYLYLNIFSWTCHDNSTKVATNKCMWQTSCIIHACAPLPFIFRLLLALCSFPLTFAFTFFVLLVCFYYLLAPLGCDFPSTCLASVANSRFHGFSYVNGFFSQHS